MNHKVRHGACVGKSKTREYVIWDSMKKRCFNKNHNRYHLYGGRGITVCNRWLDFVNFFADMGVALNGLSIDRINPDGNYEPGNCRWASSKEQAKNRRVKVETVTIDGITKPVADWLVEYGVTYNAYWIRTRRRKMIAEDAIKMPLRNNGLG